MNSKGGRLLSFDIDQRMMARRVPATGQTTQRLRFRGGGGSVPTAYCKCLRANWTASRAIGHRLCGCRYERRQNASSAYRDYVGAGCILPAYFSSLRVSGPTTRLPAVESSRMPVLRLSLCLGTRPLALPSECETPSSVICAEECSALTKVAEKPAR